MNTNMTEDMKIYDWFDGPYPAVYGLPSPKSSCQRISATNR